MNKKRSKKTFITNLILITLVIAITIGLSILFTKKIIELPEITEFTAEQDTIVIPEIARKYGIAIDSFEIREGRVSRNQFLGSILSELNLSNKEIHEIAEAVKDIFDVRKIRAGSRYKTFHLPDSLNTARYFIYEHSPVEFLRIDFSEPISVMAGEKEIKSVNKTGSGIISTSLWNSIIEAGMHPLIAIELSEIYAWSIDFFGLQPGDSFVIDYDENYVDGESIGLGKINTAYFKHAGTTLYAIPFMQDSVLSFYDEEGNSLRKAFLKAPLRYSRVSSGFSHSRMHPILRIRRPHHGVDYAAPAGTPVYAIGDGKVTEAYFQRQAGNMVKIRHNSMYTTAYLHLRGFAKGIRPGVYVKQGDLIGYVGSTGLSTGPHLDFRFYKNGQPVDPLKVEAPPVEPIREEYRAAFDSVTHIVMSRLKEIEQPQLLGSNE